MIDQHFGILAALLPLAGFASYIRDTLKGKTQPNRMSWSLWAAAPLIVFAAELAQHANLYVASLSFTLGLGPLLVVVASFTDRRSNWKLTWLDLLCGSLSIAALVLWAITGQADLAIFFSILADLFAAIPTITKSYLYPRSESAGTYLATAVGGGITLLAIPHWTFTSCGFPLYAMVVCTLIIALIALPRPRKAAANSHGWACRADLDACLESSGREHLGPHGSHDRVIKSSRGPDGPGGTVTTPLVTVGNGWAREAAEVHGQDISLMTLLEKRCYLDPRKTLNVTYGYPEGLNPDWIIRYQLNPPDDFLSVPPAEYVSVIQGYFQNLFHSGNVNLTPTCSLAFVIAARALIGSGSDEIIMMEPTYDSYAHIVRSFNATVVYAKRDAGNSVSIGSVREQYTEHTKAIILCCPDNPLGVVYSRSAFEQVITFCKQKNVTLVVDYCLAEVSPFGTEVPIVSRLDSSNGLSYILLGDTGKILGLNGSKFGAISYSDNWRRSLETAQASYFFQYNQYDLYLLSAILSDSRFPAYLEMANAQIAENYKYLQQNLCQKFKVLRMEGGCFCLIDIEELGLDDVAYTTLLMDNYSALVIPMSYFYPAHQAPATKIRISLARSIVDIIGLAEVLNSSARNCPGLEEAAGPCRPCRR